MRAPVAVLPGTLDLLILKAVSLGAQHGYGVLLRIQQMSREGLQIEQGALYPALYRLEHQGLVAAQWGVSENNRRARFYTLTSAGKARLAEDLERWGRLVETMTLVLSRRTVESG